MMFLDLPGFQLFNYFENFRMAFRRVTFEDRLSLYLIQMDTPYPLRCGIAVAYLVAVIDEDDPLFHGRKNRS